MKPSFLFEKIMNIQHEYHVLLQALYTHHNTSHHLNALDEINLFWLRNSDTVDTFLNYEIMHEDCCFFTGATDLNYHINDHYPLMLLGKYHIFDDPLSRYAITSMLTNTPFVVNKFSSKILKCLENNIKILDSCGGRILILPMRLGNEVEIAKKIKEDSEELFLGLFKDIHTIDEYFSRCSTIDDVIGHFVEDVEHYIFFLDEINMSLSFKERFCAASKELRQYFPESNEIQNDAALFFYVELSMIMQTLDIVKTCLLYNSFPMIRTRNLQIKFMLFCNNIIDENIQLEIKLKSCLSYLIYNICDRNTLSRHGFEFFSKKLDECCFYENFINNTSELDLASGFPTLEMLSLYAENKLNELYKGFIE